MATKFTSTGVLYPDSSTQTTARPARYRNKAIFGYGAAPASSVTNLVSNMGLVSTDVTGVGTARYGLAAASYGGDKAIFGYGNDGSNRYSITNLVSNIGVVATDTTGVGTTRYGVAAASYSS
jgi:hypothetical protein